MHREGVFRMQSFKRTNLKESRKKSGEDKTTRDGRGVRARKSRKEKIARTTPERIRP